MCVIKSLGDTLILLSWEQRLLLGIQYGTKIDAMGKKIIYLYRLVPFSQLVVLIALASSVSSRSKDYEDDLGRPYEFGFTIDGQQHRHESKGNIYIISQNYVTATV